MIGPDINKCRGTGAAIKIFIGAANSEIRVTSGQVNRNRPRRMRQIPDHNCTRLMGKIGNAFHVMHTPGAIIDLGEHQDSKVFVDQAFDIFGVWCFKHVPLIETFDQAIGHIKVSREIPVVRYNHLTIRAQFQRTCQCLIHLDRQSIAHNHSTRSRTNQARDKIADTLGLRHPFGIIPAPDQHFPPFILDHRLGTVCCRLWHHAKRVPIKVNDTFGNMEQGFGGGEIDHAGRSCFSLKR